MTTDHPSGRSLWDTRVLLAFITAPLASAVTGALPHMLTGDPLAIRDFKFSAEVGYPTLLVLGVPIYLLLRRLGWTRLGVYVAVGGILGVAAFVGTAASGHLVRTFGILDLFVHLPFSVLSGVIGLTVFWLIARPDQQ